MSLLIDNTQPADTADRNQISARLREHRGWLHSFATAFLARHQGSGYDPSTWTGEFKVPNGAPGSPRLKDLWFDYTKQLSYVVQTALISYVAGDLAASTTVPFHSQTVPTGWTRYTFDVNDAALRYIATGNIGSSSAGTGVSQPFTHNVGSISANKVGGSYTYWSKLADHSVLLYIDVLFASRT